MDTCRLIQVIETTLLRRGEGKTLADPIRVVTQYWSPDGKLLVEVDPHLPAAGSDAPVPYGSICACMKSVQPGSGSRLVLDFRRVVHVGACVKYAEGVVSARDA